MVTDKKGNIFDDRREAERRKKDNKVKLERRKKERRKICNTKIK